MKFDIVTIFPKVIEEYINIGILRIAQEKNLVEIRVHDLRKWTDNKHKTVDDTPYGGGPGMVMKVEPVFKAIQELKQENTKVLITTPVGEKLTQSKLQEFSKSEIDSHYIILCGRYEDIDYRVYENLVDYEFSIGDYILTGGELPALVLVDGIVRLLPDVLGNENSLDDESFNSNSLDFPQYTKPEVFNNWKVPEVLLSGNHKEIDKWRKSMSEKITREKRPDIL
jgi:tRNA (guanine37-N1)-methyltransferase